MYERVGVMIDSAAKRMYAEHRREADYLIAVARAFREKQLTIDELRECLKERRRV